MRSIESEVYFDLGAGWVKNNDVLQMPPLTWEYGIRGDGPTDLLASTGIATFHLDNSHSNGAGTPGLYSPDHDDLLAGFGEGTKVKIELPGTPWLQRFYDSIGAFDAVSPTWDAEVDKVADFDAETDADGDLNDAADAAHDGTVGLEITFDDANVAYGKMNLAAVNQTSGAITFWFDPNDAALDDGKYVVLAWCMDGAAAYHWYIWLYRSGADYAIGFSVRNDAGAFTSAGAAYVIATGYHRYDFLFKRSSGAGNDDGVNYLYLDGGLILSLTGYDNDTRDWDYLEAGMLWTNSVAFGGSFYMDTIKADPVGAPFIDQLAAMKGEYGLAIPIMDVTARYVRFTDPTNETVIVAEFGVAPKSLVMASNDSFNVIVGEGDNIGGTTVSCIVALRYLAAGGYNIKTYLYDDGGGVEAGSAFNITGEYHHIRVEWKAASAVAADDGYLKIYLDGELADSVTGIDNDQRDVDTLDFGAPYGLDAGTYGILYMDDCKWGNELTVVKFHGRIAAIRPGTGLFNDPSVEVEAHDWMGYLAGQPLGLQAVTTTKRADQALTTALTDFPIQPEATDFDTGIETFMVVFNTDSPKTSMASFFNKMCRNELGRVYVKGDGTLRFEHRNVRAENVFSLFTLDGEMSRLSVAYKRREIFNVIVARITVMEATPTADVRIWDLKVAEYFGGEIPSIAAGETLVFTCPYTDPALGGAISAMNVVDPITAVEFGSVADYETNDMIGDLGITQVVGGNASEVTMENNHATDLGYLNDLQIYGRAILVYGSRTFEARNQVSIDSGTGERRFTLRLEHVNDDNAAQAYADHILSQVKDSHLSPIRVRVLANQDGLIMAGLIEAEVSSMFTLSENVSGIDAVDFYVNNIKYTQDGLQLWVELEAGPASRYAGVLA